jgi:serine phosphatase RsbU (regulator of sigma subunit)
MTRFASSPSASDRSILRPRSPTRLLAGWAVAIGGPVVAAVLSANVLHLVPGLAFLSMVALTAVVGRMGAGLFAVVLSATLLATYRSASIETSILDGAGLASLAAFVALGVLLAVGIPRLELAADATRRTTERLTFLAGASVVLEQTLDRRQALRRLAEYVVPQLADWCAIHLQGDDGTIETVAVAHADPGKVVMARELQARRPVDPTAHTGVPHVLRTGEPEFTPRINAGLLRAARVDQETVRLIQDLGLHSAILVPLTARGRTSGVLSLIMAEGDLEYDEGDLAFAGELASRAALTLDTLSAYESAQATIVRNDILQRLAASLSRAVTLSDVVETVLIDGVREMEARAALIAQLSEDGTTLNVLGQHGYDPRNIERWQSFPVAAALPMSEAVRIRRSVVIEDEADRDLRYPLLSAAPMGDHSLVCLPLVAGGEVIGGMSVTYPVVRRFSAEDEAFLAAIASMTGQAMRRATLYETERSTSRLLQASLLPRRLPTIPRIRLAARYWASGRDTAVGGDFYDVVDSPGGSMALIGDVCGRGVEAAAVMGIARHAAWSSAERERSPAAVLATVNDVLRRRVEDYRFVTMCAVLLEPGEDGIKATVTCAGHPLPVLVSDAGVETVGRYGMLLGIYEDPPLHEDRVFLGDGGSLVLHTDGVVERGGRHVPFAEDPELAEAVRAGGNDPERIAGSIEAVLMDEHTLTDDAAVLVVTAGL